MATERLLIEVTETGARVVKRNLDEIGGAAARSATSTDLLKRALGALGVATIIREFVRLSDTFTNVQNKLRTVTSSSQELKKVTDELFGISQRTRQSFESTVTVFTRLDSTAKRLGLSQKNLFEFTESLNQAVALSGATSQEASNALIQLSQGLGASALRGEELQSVLEQLPLVADVIAKQLGVTRGELKKLGEQGKITPQVVIAAFSAAREELAGKFAKSVGTVSQAFTRLNDSLIKFVGEQDKGIGVSRILASTISLLADNVEVLAGALAALGVTATVAISGSVVRAFLAARTAVVAFTVALAANPIGLIVVALTAVVSSLTIFRNSISLGIDDVTTLGDLLRSVFGEALALIKGIPAALGPVFSTFTDFLDPIRTALGPLIAQISEKINGIEFSLAGVIRLMARFVDLAISLNKAFRDGIVITLNALPGLIEEALKRSANLAATGPLGFLLPDSVRVRIQPFAETDVMARLLGDLERSSASAFSGTGPVESFVNDRLAAAQSSARQRIAQEQARAGGSGSGATGSIAAVGFPDRKDLDALLDRLNPVRAAASDLAAGVNLLGRALAAGAISGPEFASSLDQLNFSLRDQLDPLAAVNRELDEEARLLGFASSSREIDTELIRRQQQLLQDGVKLDRDGVAALRAKIAGNDELRRTEDVRATILRDLNGNQQEELRTTSLLNELLAKRNITIEQFNRLQSESIGAQLRRDESPLGVARSALFDLREEFTDTSAQIRSTIEGAFSGLEDAIVQFAKTGKLEIRDLADSIITDLIRIGVQRNITGPLADKLFGAAGGAVAAAGGEAAASAAPGFLARAASAIGGALQFATGGSFDVGGRGGTDSQLVAFRATPGENVRINPPGSRGDSGVTINVINTTGAPVKQQEFTQADGRKMIRMIIGDIKGEIAADIAQGGIVRQAVQGTFGVRPRIES